VDEVEGKLYEGIVPGSLKFSSDSHRLAYVATTAMKYIAVVDGRESKEYDRIKQGTPVFSPDSKRVAYVAERNFKLLTVTDGVEGKEFFECAGISFTPDSRHLAYKANLGTRFVLLVDGVESKEKYDGFLTGAGLVFDSPKSIREVGFRGYGVYRIEAKIAEE